MSMRILDPEEALNLLALAQQPYRPPEIIAVQEEIAGRTRAAELKLSVTQVIDYEEVKAIVAMKLELDRLYGLWARGELASCSVVIL